MEVFNHDSVAEMEYEKNDGVRRYGEKYADNDPFRFLPLHDSHWRYPVGDYSPICIFSVALIPTS